MPSTAISAQGSLFYIGTGSGSPKTISGVTVGNPTIITATAHGFSNGDRVAIAALTGADAAALNGFTFTVMFKETNAFAVAADTTGLVITAGSGTATPVTFSKVDNVRNLNGYDGAAVEIDTTNFDSTSKEYILGLKDPGHITFECDDDSANPAQVSLQDHQNTSVIVNFKHVLPNADTRTFNGYVKKFAMTTSVDNVVKRQAEIRITGDVTKTP